MIASNFAEFHDMAFRNDQYLGSGAQYASDPMILSWDMQSQSIGASALLNSRTNSTDMPPFSSLRKPLQSSFISSNATSEGFGSDPSYSSFGNNYASSMFSSRSDREVQFQRPGSPSSNPSNMSSALHHSSSGSGLSNMTLGYGPSSVSRSLNVNGNFSRSISVGQAAQAPSSTFGSSYSANSFASSQYSGQSPSQSSNLNSFNINALKSNTGFDDLRSTFLKRPQESKRPINSSSQLNFSSYDRNTFSGSSSVEGFVSRSSAFMRGGSGFSSSNGSDGPMFDMAEFPSLTSRNRLENSMSFANVLAQGPKTSYGLSKQQGVDNPEFQMHSEDFPALPGTEGRSSVPPFDKDKTRIISGDSGDRATPNSASSLASSFSQQINQGTSAATMNSYFQSGPSMSYGMPPYRRIMAESEERQGVSMAQIRRLEEPKDYNQTAKTIYVPPSIIQDHFGLFGFLQCMKCLTVNASLPLTSVGCDLHALGLVFNPLDATPKRFKGYPFLHSYIHDSCTAHICHLDVDVPAEYLVSIHMPKEKVTPPRISKFSEDLLFYLFYGFPGDVMQYAAAIELHVRDWRYHKEEKIWITRIPAQPPTEKTGLYERGQYQYFDSLGWRKATKEMLVEYAKLEDRANFPASALQLMPQFLQNLFNYQ